MKYLIHINTAKSDRKFDKTDFMEIVSQPSFFAQMVDKLRTKSEAELKIIYLQLFGGDLVEEWKKITAEADFKNTTEEDIIKAIQQNCYQG